MAKTSLEIIILAKDQFSSVTSKLKSDLSSVGSKMKMEMGIVSGAANAAKKSIAIFGGGVLALGTYALKAASDMENMKVALKTAMGGSEEAAKKAFDTINKFAAKTPYELDETLQAFIKLKNLGLDPGEKSLTAYGNTASSMGKSLNQMIEAVADASTGEFERLKEFGIRASVQGESVRFTFQGVTTTVKNSSQDIQKYLIGIGETKFAGGMEEQSRTLSGVLSTLVSDFKVAMADMAVSSGLLEMAKNAVKSLTTYLSENKQVITDWVSGSVTIARQKVVEWYESVGGKEGITAKLTSLKNTITNDVVPAVQMLISFIVSATKYISEHKEMVKLAVVAFVAFRTAVLINGVVAALASFISFLGGATKATLALNTAMMSHPWALVITVGVGSVIAAIAQINALKKDIDKLSSSADDAFAKVRKLQEKAKSLPKGSAERKELLEKAAKTASDVANAVTSRTRATGGTVMAGKPYMVGERGPELFVPSQSGRIENNPTTNNRTEMVFNFNFEGAFIGDKEQFMREIQQTINRKQELYAMGASAL